MARDGSWRLFRIVRVLVRHGLEADGPAVLAVGAHQTFPMVKLGYLDRAFYQFLSI